MTSLRLSLVLALAVGCGASRPPLLAPSSAAPPIASRRSTPPLVIRAAHMLDVRAGTVVDDAQLFVQGGHIVDAAPEGACVIDLGDVTLLPGLVDAHTHLLHLVDARERNEGHSMIVETATLDDAHRALLGAAHAREMLHAGFTTVRDLGNSGSGGDIALRDAIARGWVDGPRMLVTGRAISGARGQFGNAAEIAAPLIDHEYAVIDGPDEARAAVRRAVASGVDGIKVIVGSETAITLSAEEIAAIVDEAHRAGRWVAAHATDDAAAAIAVGAGVDSIEHGYELSDATLRRMHDAHIALVPTDSPLAFYDDVLTASPWPTDAQRTAAAAGMRGMVAGSRERLARAMQADVTIVAGSDAYYRWGDRDRGEIAATIFRAYAEAGMSPLDIVRSATLRAATLLRLEGTIGELTPGAVADVIALQGEPLADPTTLEDVAFVLHDGVVARDDLSVATCASE